MKGEDLYTVAMDVVCVNCGNRGAVQAYGRYYPKGVGELADRVAAYEEYRAKPHMMHAVGFGGTIPHKCLNCQRVGLIDQTGLEGYPKAFTYMER